MQSRIKKLFFLTKLSKYFVGVKNFYIINCSDESADIINNVKNDLLKKHLYFVRLRNSYFTVIQNSGTKKHFDVLSGTNYVILDFFGKPLTHSYVQNLLNKNKETMFLYGANCSGFFCDGLRFHKLVYLETCVFSARQICTHQNRFKILFASHAVKPFLVNIVNLIQLQKAKLKSRASP